MYFDEQSGLLVRLVRFGETALGWLPTQIDYADYRDTNGVKIPYRWTLARPSGRFTIQVSDVKQNVPVDEAKFAKPAAEEPKGQQNKSPSRLSRCRESQPAKALHVPEDYAFRG